MSEVKRVNRCAFLVGASASALALSASVVERDADASVAPSHRAPHADASLVELSAVEAVRMMSRGELAAEHYASALLGKCAQGRALNAFITLEPARVLEAGRAADRRRTSGLPLGPLHGLPIPVKDCVNTRDYPTTAGTPALRTFRPRDDAPIVALLVGAGATVHGKTNLHELSCGWTSNNHAFGAVHNPYDPTRIPGGSSGGTAAAVAARMAPLGLAEDTEGSIRVPAALCGLAGFRPTTGRYPTAGAAPISPLFDQVGPLARTVDDLVLFDSVGSGDQRPLRRASLSGVRLAVPRKYFYAGLDPEVERLAEAALEELRTAGAELVEAEVPDLGMLIELITTQVQCHDLNTALPKYLEAYGAPVSLDEVVAQASSDIQSMFKKYVLPGGEAFVPEEVYRAAVGVHLPRLKRVFRDYYASTRAAAIVFPTTMVTATRIGEAEKVRIRGEDLPFSVAVSRNIAPGSTAGLPGLILPVGLSADGLPVSLEFDGPTGSDRTLLALGRTMEGVLGRIAAPPVA